MAQPRQENGQWPAVNAAIWLRQIAILAHCIGEDCVEILDQLGFDADANPAEDVNRMPDVLTKLDNYFNSCRNLVYEWYVFMSMNQSDCEPIDMFCQKIKESSQQARICAVT